MADDKARIEASLEGAGQVAGEARKIEGSLVGAGTRIESKLGGALRSVTGALGEAVKGGLAAAGVFSTINLARAVEDVKRLDELTLQLGQQANVTSSSLQATFQKYEQRILTSSIAQAEFARQLGGLTYDARDAVQSLDAIGEHALASGRDLGDDLPLTKALRDMGVMGADKARELERVRAIAEQLQTAGGHLALQDSLGRLDGILQGIQTRTDAARGRLEALLGVLGKGQKTPERADQVRASVLSGIRSRALDIEYATGRKVLDENGEIIDPTQTLKDLRRLSERRHGGRREEMRRALINTYGQDMGLAIFRGGFNEVDELAKLQGTGKTAAEAQQAKEDPAAKRRAKQLERESGFRWLGQQLLGVDAALTDALGAKGAAGAEVGLGLLGGLGTILGGKAAVGAGAKGAGAAVGSGILLPLLAGLGMVLPGAAVLADVGQDRETMGKDWRKEHARTIGAELARKAQEQGGFSEDMFDPSKGRGRESLLEMLKILDSRKEQLSPDFAQQVAQALASELRRAPLVVRNQPNPNQSGGGN